MSIQSEKESGYVALISVVFTAAAALLLTWSASMYIASTQEGDTMLWAKRQSYLLADGCVRTAGTRVRAGLYSAPVVVRMSENTCSIETVAPSGGGWQVQTSAVVLGAETHLIAMINGSDFTVTVESEPP